MHKVRHSLYIIFSINIIIYIDTELHKRTSTFICRMKIITILLKPSRWNKINMLHQMSINIIFYDFGKRLVLVFKYFFFFVGFGSGAEFIRPSITLLFSLITSLLFLRRWCVISPRTKEKALLSTILNFTRFIPLKCIKPYNIVYKM